MVRDEIINLIKKEQDDELLNLAGLSNIICSLNSTKKGGEAKIRIIDVCGKCVLPNLKGKNNMIFSK